MQPTSSLSANGEAADATYREGLANLAVVVSIVRFTESLLHDKCDFFENVPNFRRTDSNGFL